MFTPRDLQLERGWPGILEGDTVVQLAAQTLPAFFTGGGRARRHAEYRLTDVDLRPPVLYPPAVRDFYAFEQHVKTARALRGLEVPPEWYELPVFYFSNPAAIYGPDDEIPRPPDTAELDYELEVAAVIGARGQIGGFTIMNDWSARDLQRAEMKVGLGPAKGKDFATSLGPVLVTPDEFDGSTGAMIARVNGEERSRGQLADMYHSWEAIVAHAARNTRLRPGDLLGSGTAGTGCFLEHGDGRRRRAAGVERPARARRGRRAKLPRRARRCGCRVRTARRRRSQRTLARRSAGRLDSALPARSRDRAGRPCAPSVGRQRARKRGAP